MATGIVGDDTELVARSWLAEMEACVRAVDYERCRAIFAEDVVAFGTRAALVIGLEALERDQWRHVWGTIRGFTFLIEEMHCRGYGEEGIWLACPWTSEGRGTDGRWFERLGRMTAVLERRGDRWLAVHTHHSSVPARS
jgi:ketosteroid isomerase-like protein